MEGLDTGFFFDLRAGRSGAEELWRTVTERDDPAAVSTITLYELSPNTFGARKATRPRVRGGGHRAGRGCVQPGRG